MVLAQCTSDRKSPVLGEGALLMPPVTPHGPDPSSAHSGPTEAEAGIWNPPQPPFTCFLSSLPSTL